MQNWPHLYCMHVGAELVEWRANSSMIAAIERSSSFQIDYEIWS